MAISGMTGAVYVSDVNTAPVSFNDETCSAVDAQRKRYQIDEEDYRYWDPSVPVLVEVNGSLVSAGFTLEHAGGFVVFEDALDAEDEVTVSGKALTLPVSFNDETCSAVDAQRKRYQIDDPDLMYWDPTYPVLVEVNDEPVSTGFTLEHAGGYIIFNSALEDEDEVTVSGKALTLTQAGGFFNWSIDGDADDADATTFASQGWKEFARTLKGWSGSAEAYWGDEQFFDSLGKTVVVKLFVDSGPSQDCLEGFAVINGDGIEAPVDGLVQEAVDFTGTGPLYIRI